LMACHDPILMIRGPKCGFEFHGFQVDGNVRCVSLIVRCRIGLPEGRNVDFSSE
jgi:hypothetical protein